MFLIFLIMVYIINIIYPIYFVQVSSRIVMMTPIWIDVLYT